MAATLIPLKVLDIQTNLSKIQGLQSQAESYSKIGAPKLPGIPDMKEQIRVKLEAEKDKLVDLAKKELIALLVLVMAAGVAKLAGLIPEINRVIKVLNKIIDGIQAAITTLMPIAIGAFVVIIALTITVVITKIITKIPSIAIAFGTGISLDMPKSFAQGILNAAEALLEMLKPIAFQIISFMLMILKLYGFLLMIMGIIKMFTSQQTKSASTASDAFNRSAGDWSDITDTKDTTEDIFLVECTLPNGSVEKLSPEDCVAAGGTFPGMELLEELNYLENKIRDCEAGEIQNKDCINYKSKRDSVCTELGNLCDFKLNEFTITSLMNPQQDVTIEKATKNTGKRKGFYSEDI